MNQKNKTSHRGVIPSNNLMDCVVHKSVKKNQKSFRITSSLLNNLCKKAKTIEKTPLLIITIPANEKENYVLKCRVMRENKND